MNDLTTAITTMEALVDLRSSTMQEGEKSKSFPKKKKFEKKKTFQKKITRKSIVWKPREEKNWMETKQTGTSAKVMECYICSSTHLVHECPKGLKLPSLVTEEDSDVESSIQLNSLQVLGKQLDWSQS